MKIAVAAATGRVARKVIREAKNRGFEVTAFARNQAEIDGADQVIVKDIFDLTKEDLVRYDTVVDAFGAWTEDALPQHSTSLAHLCDCLSGSDTRLLVVGGVDFARVSGLPDSAVRVIRCLVVSVRDLDVLAL